MTQRHKQRYTGPALLLAQDALERGDRVAACEWIWLDLDDEMAVPALRPAPESLELAADGDAVLYVTAGEWNG